MADSRSAVVDLCVDPDPQTMMKASCPVSPARNGKNDGRLSLRKEATFFNNSIIIFNGQGPRRKMIRH